MPGGSGCLSAWAQSLSSAGWFQYRAPEYVIPAGTTCLGRRPHRARHCFSSLVQPLVAGSSYRRRNRHNIGWFVVNVKTDNV